MVMVVVMLHDARAAAGALLEERRNEAGEWIACRHIPRAYTGGLVVAVLLGVRTLVTISTSLA